MAEFDGKDKYRQRICIEHLNPYIGHLPLIDVDTSALTDFKDDRREGKGHFTKPAMAGTINKEISTVMTILNKAARKWRWIPCAPMLEREAGPVRRSHPLTWEEQVKLLYRLDDELRQMCEFVLNTGLMREELFKLRWCDSRDIEGVDHFVLQNGYDGRNRPIVLNSVTREIIEQLRTTESEFLFRRQYVSKPINDAWIKAGLPNHPLIRKGINNLRFTFANRLRAAGATEDEYNYMLGRKYFHMRELNVVIDFRRLAELAERITRVTDAELAIYI